VMEVGNCLQKLVMAADTAYVLWRTAHQTTT
jgi:hypothetical protein